MFMQKLAIYSNFCHKFGSCSSKITSKEKHFYTIQEKFQVRECHYSLYTDFQSLHRFSVYQNTKFPLSKLFSYMAYNNNIHKWLVVVCIDTRCSAGVDVDKVDAASSLVLSLVFNEMVLLEFPDTSSHGNKLWLGCFL